MTHDQGIVCEMDNQTIKIFCRVSKKVRPQANRFSERYPIRVGQFWRLCHDSEAEEKAQGPMYAENVQFFVNPDNVLMAETWAITPNKEDLSEEMWKRYGRKIWSPFLGFLNDPENLFATKYKPRQRGPILVQYAPTEDTVFSIVSVNDTTFPAFVMMYPAPWETTDNWTPWEDMIHDGPMRNKALQNAFVRHSLCVATKKPNLEHNPMRHGSTYFCDHLFTAKYGLVRSLWWRAEKGQWYQHRFTSPNEPDSFTKPFNAVCVTDLIHVPAPLPTRVMNGDVEVTTSFLFNHADIEELRSESENPWGQRSEGIKEDAHFVDKFLGKVEIYPYEAAQILKLVDSLHRDFYNSRTEDPMIVTVNVRLLNDYVRNNNTYPRHGLFFVYTVVDVNYKE